MISRNSLPYILLSVVLFSSLVVNAYFYMDLVSLRGDIAEMKTSYEGLNEEYTNLMEEHRRVEDRLKYYELWNGEPEIADPHFLPPKGNQSRQASLGAYHAVASKLGAIIDREEYEILREALVYHYPDWNNGTAYVALYDAGPEITNTILDLFDPYVQEQIRFVKAPAPLNKIEEWREALYDCDLRERGIKPTYGTMYYDGKILFGIEEISPSTIPLFKEAIEGKVPPGVIVLEETGPIELRPDTQEAETPVVNPGALDVEVLTDDIIYLLGEEIELSVYLYNDRLRDVQIEDAGFVVWSYYAHEKSTKSIGSIGGSPINNPMLLTVPAKSRILYGRTKFKAEVTGSFIIECLGEKITLKIVFHHEDSNL